MDAPTFMTCNRTSFAVGSNLLAPILVSPQKVIFSIPLYSQLEGLVPVRIERLMLSFCLEYLRLAVSNLD